MKIFRGKPIAPGYAQGRAVILGSSPLAVTPAELDPGQIDTELERFRSALDSSYRELEHLQVRIRSELGSASADIFSAHLLFLRDPQFVGKVETRVRDDRRDLESAIKTTIDELASLLAAADDAYLRERAADVRDLHRRLARHLAPPGSQRLTRLPPGSVLVARELLPSDLLEFDRAHLVGIVSEMGGETGHAAILARALGVPAVTGIANATRVIKNEMPVLVDGQTGEVVLEPARVQIQAARADQTLYDRVTRDAIAAEDRACETRDGVGVKLLANLAREFEVDEVVQHNLDGVGLFRTEFLYLNQAVAPDCEHQYAIYCRAAERLGGRPLTVRTLDLGGDKWPAFLHPRFEANPNLGVRGLRFSLLASQDLFREQLRAMLLASRAHDVRILLPMVIGLADLREALGIVRAIAREEGIAHLPPIGALVETPAAVFSIAEILAAADFVSIGTNDLTQFMLAVDRNALALIDDYTVLHPAVMRAVHDVVTAADKAGKPATLCGEAAGSPAVARLLVGLGVRCLSMSPKSAARVRWALRASSSDELQDLARRALASGSAQEVATLVADSMRAVAPGFDATAIAV